MHPWHDVPIPADAALADSFPVIVEIPKGSKNKYELDKPTGLLKVDRVLFSAVHYPANYGFVPRTLEDDGDPADVLVLGQESIVPLALVEARAIGGFEMRDEHGVEASEPLRARQPVARRSPHTMSASFRPHWDPLCPAPGPWTSRRRIGTVTA